LEAEMAAMGERLSMSANAVRDRLDRSGRLAAVRSDRRKMKAAEWLIDNVELIDENGDSVSRDELKVKDDEEVSE
jgi:hypothetical protein